VSQKGVQFADLSKQVCWTDRCICQVFLESSKSGSSMFIYPPFCISVASYSWEGQMCLFHIEAMQSTKA
jgi:hypothetical protein